MFPRVYRENLPVEFHSLCRRQAERVSRPFLFHSKELITKKVTFRPHFFHLNDANNLRNKKAITDLSSFRDVSFKVISFVIVLSCDPVRHNPYVPIVFGSLLIGWGYKWQEIVCGLHLW